MQVTLIGVRLNKPLITIVVFEWGEVFRWGLLTRLLLADLREVHRGTVVEVWAVFTWLFGGYGLLRLHACHQGIQHMW